MTNRTRLYGQPDAEQLWYSLEDLWQHELAEWVDENETRSVTVHIHSVLPPQRNMVKADDIIEFMVERSGEWHEADETFCEKLKEVADKRSEYLSIWLDLVASDMTYRMADEQIGTCTIEIVDGKPHYPELVS